MQLRAACELASAGEWRSLAEALGLLEETMHRLSHPVPPGTDPVIAATMLLIMLACAPERIGRSDMPDVLADFDLSPNGEPWKRWMAVIEPLRQEPRWRRIAVSAECADLSLMIKSCAWVARRSER
jgi:hypothetical protein